MISRTSPESPEKQRMQKLVSVAYDTDLTIEDIQAFCDATKYLTKEEKTKRGFIFIATAKTNTFLKQYTDKEILKIISGIKTNK